MNGGETLDFEIRPNPAPVSAAERSALRTRVDADRVPRAPRDVETAVYFCCLEAMQNADKHAGENARVAVRLWHDGASLRFSVTDDGAGFDPASAGAGAGVDNMRDRLESVGGGLEITSAPDRGTRVDGHAPAG